MRIAASLLLVVLWLVPLAGHGAAPVLYSDTLRIDAVEEPENGLDAETEINLDDEAIEITPLAGGGAGPAADDAEIDLGSIEVYGNRSLAAVLDDTRALTVITAADFAGAMTAAEVLERVPGVDVRLQGGQGQLSSVLVRGARAQQVLVLIDGQAASMESMDLALLPLGGIERIEVVRGPAAARFGPGAMGGVVNLVTHRPAAPDRGEADAATTLPLNEHRAELWPPADPADAAPLDVSVTTTAGGYSSLSTEIHAIGPGESYFISHLQARNNYEYERRGGSVATRRNNEAGRQAFWAAWNDGAYTHRMGATHLRRGVPGTAEFPTTAARLGHDALWWQTSGPGWRGDLSLSHRHFTDPDPVLNRGPVDTKTTTAQLEFAAGSLAGQPAAWGIRPRFAYSDSGNGSHARAGVDLHHYWSARHGRATLSADAGLVASSDVVVDLVGHIGVDYDLGNGARTYAGAAYAVRHPAFSELYYANTGGVRGNPDLHSERVLNYELGAGWTGQRARCEIAAFFSDYRDSIIWAPVSAYTVAAINTGAAEVAGVEVLFDVQLSQGVWWRTAGTWLPRAEFDSGVPLTGRAARRLNTRLEYNGDAWRGAVTADCTGPIPADLFGSLVIGSRTLVGCELSHDFAGNEVGINIANLFDISARDSWDYPLQGREMYVTWTTDL